MDEPGSARPPLTSQGDSSQLVAATSNSTASNISRNRSVPTGGPPVRYSPGQEHRHGTAPREMPHHQTPASEEPFNQLAHGVTPQPPAQQSGRGVDNELDAALNELNSHAQSPPFQ